MNHPRHKHRKLLLAACRAARPRWGLAYQQRVVAPAKGKQARKPTTRTLLEREG